MKTKTIVIMFDIETRAAWTMAMEEYRSFLIKNTEESFSSAMPYWTIIVPTKELVN